jgi:uncharacterized protein
MHPYAYLFRAITTTLLLAPIAGAAVEGPYDHALAAWRRGEYTTAYRLWRPIADEGDPDAQFYLGFMSEYGQGGPQNSMEAVKWYRKAADQQHAVAQFSLGVMYANGEGVPRSDTEAAQWYRLAADQGLGSAQFDLGTLYARGRGVPEDHVLAYMWLDLVASELAPLAKHQRNTAIDALDLVAAKMSSTQVAEARQLALEWTIERRQRAQQKSFAMKFH